MNGWANIFSGLRAAVANKAAPYRGAVDALLCLVWHRLNRIHNRLERLIAHWRAGTLPKPRLSRGGRKRTRALTPRPNYPTTNAWLIARVGYTAAGFASQLNHTFLNDPEFAEFLKAVPQAGRILRPLCHMLGITPPQGAALPPRPRPPRAPKPPRPTPRTPPPVPAHLRRPIGRLRWDPGG